MNISLTPELAKFVEKEVESGLYQTASEVVRAGLRRLKEDQAARLPQLPKTLEELEAQLLQSIDDNILCCRIMGCSRWWSSGTGSRACTR